MDFATFRSLPKAEVHVHLEGAMRPQRALALARRQADHPWARFSPADLAAHCRTTGFEDFLARFIEGYRLLRGRDDFQAVCEDLCASFEEQGVVKAQVLYSPGVYIQKLGLALRDIHDGIEAGLRQFPGIGVTLVVDTVLNLGFDFMETTLEAVLADRRSWLGGFSVGGGDPDLDMRSFLPLFLRARRAGLFCVAHAGEVDGADNIEILVREAEVRRIAHGCAAAARPALCALLRERGITVDVSLTSNLRTGAVRDGAHPPAAIFLAQGVPITLNTDDPLYVETDLFTEYLEAARVLQLTDADLAGIMEHSLRIAEAPFG